GRCHATSPRPPPAHEIRSRATRGLRRNDLHIVQSNQSKGFFATRRTKSAARARSPPVREHGRMNHTDVPTTDISSIPDELPEDLVVLDVREQHEWDSGHIAGAVHIPMSELQ